MQYTPVSLKLMLSYRSAPDIRPGSQKAEIATGDLTKQDDVNDKLSSAEEMHPDA